MFCYVDDSYRSFGVKFSTEQTGECDERFLWIYLYVGNYIITKTVKFDKMNVDKDSSDSNESEKESEDEPSKRPQKKVWSLQGPCLYMMFIPIPHLIFPQRTIKPVKIMLVVAIWTIL